VSGIYVLKIGSKTSILTIESVRAYHGGNYTCTATNAAGLSQFTAHLAVNGIAINVWVFSSLPFFVVLCFVSSSAVFTTFYSTVLCDIRLK
jgi:hypothetical protein